MEGETWCSGSRLSDNVTTACICVVTEWKWVSLKKKKKKKKKKIFFFFFFRETHTSPWVPFRAKFRPPGRPFRPSRPLAWSLDSGKLGWDSSFVDALGPRDSVKIDLNLTLFLRNIQKIVAKENSSLQVKGRETIFLQNFIKIYLFSPIRIARNSELFTFCQV